MTAPGNALRQPLAQALLPLQGGDWWPLLQRWQSSSAGQALAAAVDARVQAGAVVYPAEVFRALALTTAASVRVVILGQDPYHGPGQADGLAFSVPGGQRCPPSLRNIFKELQRDQALYMPAGATSLLPWARQGVLLLNTSLTVEAGQAGSHSKLGWQALTDAIVQEIATRPGGVVFMLWGAHAQGVVDRHGPLAPQAPTHLLLRSNHPSPLSALRGPAPFLGCGHFGLANQWFKQRGEPPIDWHLPSP